LELLKSLDFFEKNNRKKQKCGISFEIKRDLAEKNRLEPDEHASA
jgi:hypothetical protein